MNLTYDLISQCGAEVIKKRKKNDYHKDIWDFSFHRTEYYNEIMLAIKNNTYRFHEVKIFKCEDNYYSCWSTRDSVVLKCLAKYFQELAQLNLSKRCFNIKNHGGCSAATKSLLKELKNYNFIYKTDVRSYYASINHKLMLKACNKYCDDLIIMRLVKNILEKLEYFYGEYKICQRGICRGSSLSPILGAFFLDDLDKHFEKKDGIKYFRYQDDILILARTPKSLERAKTELYDILNDKKLTTRPEKTYGGSAFGMFDFLGFRFKNKKIISTAGKTTKKVVKKLHKKIQNLDAVAYLKNLSSWVKGIVNYKDLLAVLYGIIYDFAWTLRISIIKNTEFLFTLLPKVYALEVPRGPPITINEFNGLIQSALLARI